MDLEEYMVRGGSSFEQLEIRYEPDKQAVWGILKYSGRPCANLDILREIAEAQKIISETAKRGYREGDGNRLLYQIVESERPGVFGLGGDLEYFMELIRSRNRDALYEYAKLCVDVSYPVATSYGIPFTTIALVQGEALGGGFEAALSANILIAEQSASFAFPETVFGLFPGMGAFNFLARRVAPALAKRIITSGRIYSAAELHEMGVVDILATDGKGREAVYDFMKHRRNRSAGFQGLDVVMDQFNPLTHRELLNSVNVWVDTAMQLTEKNLRLMEYLLRAQEKRWNGVQELPVRYAV